METEKRDKLKKKKTKKGETNTEQTDELSSEMLEKINPNERRNPVGDLQTTAKFLPAGKESLIELLPDFATDGGRNMSEGFYIAHPRNIKRTAHFKDVHSRKLAELLEAFHMFDFDRDGVINHDDLRKSFASLCMDVEDEEINQMLSEGLNPPNFDAFVILLGYRTLDLDPEEVLLDALSNWDDHESGLISYDRIMQHIMVWGDKFTEEEAVSALADAPIVLDKTKEKMIDYIQFSEDLCGLRKMMQRRTKGD